MIIHNTWDVTWDKLKKLMLYPIFWYKYLRSPQKELYKIHENRVIYELELNQKKARPLLCREIELGSMLNCYRKLYLIGNLNAFKNGV